MGPTSHRDVNQSPGYNRTIRQPPATGASRESAFSIEVHLEMRHWRPAGRNAVGLTLQRDCALVLLQKEWFFYIHICRNPHLGVKIFENQHLSLQLVNLWGPMGTYGDLWGPMGTFGDLWGWGPMGTCGDL